MSAASRVLCLLIDGFEEIELVTPVDLLRRAGAHVTLASLTGAAEVKGRSGIVLRTDADLDALDTAAFDLLIIPGGPGVKALREDGRPAELAKTFVAQDKTVAAICAAPAVLKDAALLDGKRFTAHVSVHGELPDVSAEERVIIDGRLITSRGAGTALDFGLALVEQLFGADKAREIAMSIMA